MSDIYNITAEHPDDCDCAHCYDPVRRVADLQTQRDTLARALIESQAALAAAEEGRVAALDIAKGAYEERDEARAALAAATEEQSRAWALLTGERWTQTRAEGSLVEAAARMRDQLAAANARAETAERQIAVHEASAQEQLRLSLAVGAAMREVTQTEIGSGNHAAARARWEEAKKKFAAFQLAPLAGPLERIEAERDALRDDLARVTAERDEARDRLIEVVPVLNRVIEERDAALATAERFAKCVDAVAPHAAPAPTPAAAKETPAAVPGLVTVRAKIVALRDCKCEASSGCMRAQWEAEVLAVVDAAHNAARLAKKGGE